MQLPLHEFSISSIAFIKLHSKDSHATVVTKCLAKITILFMQCGNEIPTLVSETHFLLGELYVLCGMDPFRTVWCVFWNRSNA